MKLAESVACTHPDHEVEEGTCIDREFEHPCSAFCECCLGPFSVHTNKMQARIEELEEEVNRLLKEQGRQKLGLSRGVMYEAIFLLQEGLDKTKDDELMTPMATYKCRDCECVRECCEGSFVCRGCLGMNGEKIPCP